MLQKASKVDFPILIDIWEKSVRATHDFLPDSEINSLKSLILNQYFYHTLLYTYIQDEKIIGFIGTSSDNIEMLFIAPEFRGQGVGKILVNFAITELKIKKADVNEQNLQALGFYKKLGFQIINKSELDGQGNPYPILHLKI